LKSLHDHGIAAVRGPCHEGGELPDLGLTQAAGIQRVVEHDDEQLNRTARTVDGGEHSFSGAVAVVVSKRLTLALRDRPARDDTDA
jgi:hypothetical protein